MEHPKEHSVTAKDCKIKKNTEMQKKSRTTLMYKSLQFQCN